VAWPGAEGPLGGLPEAMGLTSKREVPVMVLPELPSAMPAPPDGLTIRAVEDPDRWAELIVTGVLGMGGARVERPLELFPFSVSETHRAFLGTFRGRPVATSVGHPWNGVVGINFVATLPEFRGRGFGTAMTWRAAAVARSADCPIVTLHASPMGYPVYRRMGFVERFRYTEWATPRPSGAPA